MFQYISLYKQNGSGQHLKVAGFTILQIIICMLLPMILIGGAMVLPLLLTFTNVSGEAIGIGAGIWILLMFILTIAVAIFLIYPIFVGILRYFASAYKGRDFSFGEAYKVFKGGNYSKLIKIALLVFVLYFVLSLIIGFIVNILMTLAAAPLMPLVMMMDNSGGALSGGSIALIITAFALMLIVTIIAYIPYIILYIYFAIVFMVYIDEPQIPTVDKLKVAWDVAFRSEASMVKLFFSNLLLYIIMTAAIFILFGGIGILALFMTDSPGLIIVLGITGFILALLISIYISYLIVGSIVAYYFVGRDSLDRMAEQKAAAPAYKDENIELQ